MRRTETTVLHHDGYRSVEIEYGPALTWWERYKERRVTRKLMREVCKYTGGTTSMGWKIVAVSRVANQLTVELEHDGPPYAR